MLAAVEHVHHRNGQHVGVGSTDVTPQRDLEFVGRSLSCGEADAENGVRSDPAFVVGTVGGDQFGVDKPLVCGVEADDRVGEFAVDEANGGQHALAVESIAAIAQLDRFEGAGGGAEGTIARPMAPESRPISTSTVGLPRESKTSRPWTCSMVLMTERPRSARNGGIGRKASGLRAKSEGLRATASLGCSAVPGPSVCQGFGRLGHRPPCSELIFVSCGKRSGLPASTSTRRNREANRWAALRSAASGSTSSLRATCTPANRRSPTSCSLGSSRTSASSASTSA